ncbi:unnamed protein product [Arctogadus glacialis]
MSGLRPDLWPPVRPDFKGPHGRSPAEPLGASTLPARGVIMRRQPYRKAWHNESVSENLRLAGVIDERFMSGLLRRCRSHLPETPGGGPGGIMHSRPIVTSAHRHPAPMLFPTALFLLPPSKFSAGLLWAPRGEDHRVLVGSEPSSRPGPPPFGLALGGNGACCLRPLSKTPVPSPCCLRPLSKTPVSRPCRPSSLSLGDDC